MKRTKMFEQMVVHQKGPETCIFIFLCVFWYVLSILLSEAKTWILINFGTGVSLVKTSLKWHHLAFESEHYLKNNQVMYVIMLQNNIPITAFSSQKTMN